MKSPDSILHHLLGIIVSRLLSKNKISVLFESSMNSNFHQRSIDKMPIVLSANSIKGLRQAKLTECTLRRILIMLLRYMQLGN